MTNFEKWKGALKPEDLIRYNLMSNSEVMCLDCNNCPAQGECPFIYAIRYVGKYKSMVEYESDQEENVRKCKEVFLGWANKEADL